MQHIKNPKHEKFFEACLKVGNVIAKSLPIGWRYILIYEWLAENQGTYVSNTSKPEVISMLKAMLLRLGSEAPGPVEMAMNASSQMLVIDLKCLKCGKVHQALTVYPGSEYTCDGCDEVLMYIRRPDQGTVIQ